MLLVIQRSFPKLNIACYVCLLVYIINSRGRYSILLWKRNESLRRWAKVPKTSDLFGVVSFNKIGFVWNRKITVCSFMVTSICITSEYCTVTQSDARFDSKANTKDILWFIDSYIHEASYGNDEVTIPLDH